MTEQLQQQEEVFVFETSFAQERLWFLDQLSPGGAAYNIFAAVRARGPLDAEALRAALLDLADRHEVLRTAFSEEGDAPVQVIDPNLDPEWRTVDLRGEPADRRQAEALRRAAEEGARPFDLAAGPLLRMTLYQLADEDAILTATMHHIISDGWSMGVLIRDLGALYARRRGEAIEPLPELSIQYGDFAEWQREYLSGDRLGRLIDAWRERLAGAPEALSLSTDRPRSAMIDSRGAVAPALVPAATLTRLETICGQEATPFMIALAAYASLLARYANQDDVVIGAPIANRNRKELEPLIGFFVNTLALRVRLDDDPSFRQLLARVRQLTLEAYELQDLPFEKLVEDLNPERRLDRSPIFQAVLNVQNAPVETMAARDLAFETLSVDSAEARFDLSLSLAETERGLEGGLTYREDLFDSETAAQLARHFVNLLEGFATQPDRSASAISLIDPSERIRILETWNDTECELEAGSWPQAFEAQVHRAPAATAVVDDAEHLDFAALNARANRLAHRLRGLGARPGARVAICLERSTWLATATLGVLKSGAAYAPLDPAYPAERLAAMIHDMDAAVAVAQASTDARFADADTPRVLVDEDFDAASEANPAPLAGPEDIAYLIFTSGSTGRPKGAAVRHRSVMNLLSALDRRVYAERQRPLRVSLNASLAFDASVKQLVRLLRGDALFPVPDEVRYDAVALADWLNERAVDVLDCTPAQLKPLAPLWRRGGAPGWVLAGGEALDESDWRTLAGLADTRCFNLYGPTECTVDALIEPISRNSARPSLGRPVANTRAYVVDTGRQLCPPRVPGELVLGGVGLALGYWGRPAETAARFTPDPFGATPGDRLYRTGDLARWTADGRVAFLGRVDFQVKLRGYRVELGEIEAALRAQPGVRAAVVTVREDRPGRPLAAYWVGDGPTPPSTTLRAALRRRLPDYMVPQSFIKLPDFPLTANGKLDRKALPRPDLDMEPGEAVSPRTPEEEIMAGVWAEVLGLNRVGVDDNFFDLGGHSLLATQVISRVRAAFSVDLPVRALFEAPTIAELAARAQSAAGVDNSPIEPVSRDRALPLSFAQQRLWFLNQMDPEADAAYNIFTPLQLDGALDLAALEDALQALVRRHETLQTFFTAQAGSPVQITAQDWAPDLTVIDLSAMPRETAEREAASLVAAEATRPFRLDLAPPIRARALRTAWRRNAVLINLHHIITDGWSNEILVRELIALYRHYALEEAATLPALTVQYADYAAWQRRWLSGDNFERLLGYWRGQLANLPERLDLPTDRPRPATITHRGAVEPIALDAALAKTLESLGRQAGATPFMILLATWAALLGRYTRQDDVAVGTPIANRNRREIEPLIGFFVNTLVMRLRLDHAASFRALIDQTRHVALDAYAHQDMPFERLVEALQPQRSLSHTPLFQVMFILQNAPAAELRAPGLTISPLGGGTPAAKFDLTLALGRRGEALTGSLVYNADLFEAAAIRRMAAHFQNLLRAALANPDAPLHRLEMIDDDESRLLLRDWNDTARPAADERMVPARLAARAALAPDRPALAEPGRALTYGALLTRADRLAARLARSGAGPETTVAVCLPRSADMVVALVAAWRVGSPYLPLDPNAPAPRLQWIMKDAGVCRLLTTAAQRELTADSGQEPIFLEEADAGAAPLPSPAWPRPQNLAYVIYTSGSTGRPKGVAVEHNALARLADWRLNTFPMAQTDRTTLIANPAFDASVWEVWPTLSAGACLVPVDDFEALDPEKLRDRLLAARVTAAFAPTPVAEPMLAMSWPAACSLRRLQVGGDVLRKRPPFGLPFALFNNYGPTECTVVASSGRVAASGQTTPSIGRPIDNTRLYLLDRFGHPAPLGAPGELFIGGSGVARGYLGRPDLTAASFTPDPFGETAGARLYRSGDLARYRADGQLEFLGRADFQVKLRGFRIELGEIEARALDFPGVAEAAAAVREGPADKLLALYTVGLGPDGAASLRAFLAERLPGYMVPGFIASLSELPRTPNGKLDRKALSHAAEYAPERDERTSFTPPRTPEEILLAETWTEALGRERIGVYDDFFALGGHSLLATRVVARIRDRLGVELPVRALFEAPTVAELAQRVQTAQGRERPPLQPADREQSLPLSFAQQRLWFLDQLEPGSVQYHIPIALRLGGALDAGALEAARDTLSHRHETLRTRFIERDGEPWQVCGPPRPRALVLVDLGGLPVDVREATLSHELARAAAQSFDLARGPLWRAAVFRLASEDHALAVVMHHIISDGWSIGALIRDWTAAYAMAAHNHNPALAPLAIQYADYALWQRQWLAGAAMQRQLDYWKGHLAGLPERLELPTDRPRPEILGSHGGALPLVFDEELTADLTAFGRRVGATSFMTVLAALGVLLGRYSRQEDLAIGSPIAGRTETALEPLIGFFVNTLALRLQLGQAADFQTLVHQARQTTLAAYANQDAPFERLVDELSPRRSMSHTPLFQVLFVWQNTPEAALSAPGLTLQPMALEREVAKFDLTVTLGPQRGRIAGTVQFKRDLFEPATVERMIGHFRNLVQSAVRNPERSWRQLSLLSAEERDQALQLYNQTAREIPTVTLHGLFEHGAAQWPHAPAVVFRDRALSYGRLNTRANQIAGLLRVSGAAPGDRVALFLERSAEMTAAMLAALKAGAAYVPIDVDVPDKRLDFILHDAKATTVITERRLADRLPTGLPVLLADQIPTEAFAKNPHTPVDVDALAYVIYTSGSTGQPKGVAVSHRAAVNYRHGAFENLALQPGMSFALVSTPAADLGLTGLLGALTGGGCLHILTREQTTDAEQFAGYLERRAIDGLKITPSHLAALGATGASAACLPSRRLILGGEASPSKWTLELARQSPRRLVFNHYGPTEATVGMLTHRIDPHKQLEAASPPLGLPIGNMTAYALEPGGEPSPAGAPGELYIGGAGLARGYWSRPDLTAARFTPNPFVAEPGARLYRTGDLVRRLAEGSIEFIGRVDFQLKVRGFRVEPGEIEAALRQQAGVREAVVSLREAAADRAVLTAHLVGDEALDPAKLRSALESRLPAHMIPEAFMILDRLPLTPNGKLDRAALPLPESDAGRSSATIELEEPRTPQEEILAAIWTDLLGLERVGVGDHFFELGGHSLLAIRVVARIRAALDVELPVRALFETPVLADLARSLAGAEGRATPPIEPLPRNRSQPLEAPLSFAQQRLWFLDRLAPGSAAYHVPGAVRLDGPLSVLALTRALDAAVDRHETLRTVFPSGDGAPVQRVLPPRQRRWPLLDLSGLPSEIGRHEVTRHIAREFRRPFDLARGPSLRASLIRLHGEAHVLTLTMHHIVSDGWSQSVLLRDITAAYGAAARQPERVPRLPSLPVQYADYAVWQRRCLAGEAMGRQLDYWTAHLADLPEMLTLPTDRPRPPVQTERGGSVQFELDAALGDALSVFSRQNGATPFMTLLATLGLLLSRYSRQDDVAIGSPIAGRVDAALDSLVGFFVNTLVYRIQLQAGGFRELLAQTRRTALDAYAHQDAPFERLVEELQPRRNLNHAPLFQVMFLFQNAPERPLSAPGLHLTPLEASDATAKFDQSWTIARFGSVWSGGVTYNADLFDNATAHRMAVHFQNLLRAALAEPDAPLQRIDMIDDDERRLLLRDWNDTGFDFGPPPALHRLVEAAAARDPHAPALRFGEEALCYADLEGRANRLAAALRARGARPGSRVGVCLDREPAMVATLLAALKNGAAYVSLDPAYPAQRLALILQDACPIVVVTRQDLVDRLPSGSPALPLETLEDQGPDFAAAPVAPQQMAYLLFTSGSTGRPKGVAIPHAAAARMVQWAGTVFDRHELSGVLAATSINFDLSVFELFVPLTHGGAVVLARDALALPELPQRDRVTLVNTVPSAMAELLRLEAIPTSVRTVNLAGEALPRHTTRALYALPHVQKVYNLYGPSEDTTYSTFTLVDVDGSDAPAIGRPIANTRAYVADPSLRLAARGAPGELLLAGAGLGRGYLNRPALTAERFIPDPFGEEPGGRLYRTSDLARWRPDGELAYLGRTDFQVKLRGFRIELGEIEARLGALAEISDAAVVVREDRTDLPRLIAYATAKQGAAVDPADLRAALRTSLPDYMVPEAVVILEALPLTPNGKLNRKALSNAAEYAPERDGQVDLTPPRTPEEGALVEIWTEVLDREQVGVHDDFFALGGHSLLATRVVARARDRLGVELPVRDLFEVPTVAELADRVLSARSRERPPIQPIDRDQPLPLSFAQQRLWFLDQLEPGSAQYHISGALRLAGPLDAAAFHAALEAIVARHETLRTVFAEEHGEPRQIIAESVSVALPIVDLCGLPAAARELELTRQVNGAARRPFDLARGPLLRAALFRHAAGEHALSVAMHHIVSDGWSLETLIRELTAVYAARIHGLDLEAPPLPIQYAEYAAWQRRWLADKAMQRQLDYWKKQLAGLPERLALLTDRAPSPMGSNRGAMADFTLEAETGNGLASLSREVGATPFMTFLAGLGVLLSRYSRQDDLAIGTPIAGRVDTALEPLIGLFVNTLVIRVQPDARLSFRTLLAQVRHTALEAYACQDAPFERLVEELQPQRSLSHTPLFQVMLAVLNPSAARLETPGLRLSPLPVETTSAKFDQNWTLAPQGQTWRGSLEYSVELFEQATIQRMIGHFQNVLRAVSAEPDTPLHQLEMTGELERRQLLEVWSGAQSQPVYVAIDRLIRAEAARGPQRVAVRHAGHAIAFGAMIETANRLARQLREMGARPGTTLGLRLQRDHRLPIALLAALETGAAYVPLDPEWPAERLAWVAEDAGLSVILNSAPLIADDLPAPAERCSWLELSPSLTDLNALPTQSPAFEPHPLSPAYLIYTSGSTGRPKGVMVSHGALSAFARTVADRYQLGPDDCVLQFASVGFDMLGEEIFPTLIRGARLLAPRRDDRESLARFGECVRRERITTLNLPAAFWHAWVDDLSESGRTELPHLRLMIAGSERVSPERAWRWRSLVPGAALYNAYGPTETTVTAVVYDGDAASREQSLGVMPIGRPLDHTTAYALDAGLRPVPVGTPGELCLGGASLAAGYRNRPAHTAARFIPNPFAPLDRAGSRLYLTGDLVRWLPDGNLDFLGRLDFQIKLRGFRIEPGEIEAKLREHPMVNEAAVLARRDARGLQRLTAYATVASETIDTLALQARLRNQLPAYMVPDAFVILNAMPLSPNGKLDRAALRRIEPGPARADGHEPGLATKLTQREETLAALWADVLKQPNVNPDDNFFDLGGHSLLAVQAAARIRRAFGMEAPLRLFFEAPTVRAMARALTQAQTGLAPPPLTPAARREGPFEAPLSYAQQRLWFLDQLETGSTYHIPMAVRAHGSIAAGALETALNEVIRRHQVLGARFAIRDGAPVQAPGETALALQVVDFANAPDRERTAIALASQAARKPFDLERDRLLRAWLLRLTDDDAILAVVVHHIVFDGWSSNILMRELSELYQAALARRQARLAAPPIQYADFAVWQRDWLQGEPLNHLRRHWLGTLQGAPAALELPTDRPRPERQRFRGADCRFRIDASLTARLKQTARAHKATLFMVLAAGYFALLRWFSGQRDIVFGTDSANRNQVELEALIGFFVNQLPLRARMDDEASLAKLLAQTRQVALDAFDHEDLPFDMLVEALNPERTNHAPVFQVKLTLQNQPTQTLGGNGPALSPVLLDRGAAQLDFLFVFTETQDGLAGNLEYNRELFLEATAQRLRDRFRDTLATLADRPDTLLGDLTAELDRADRRARRPNHGLAKKPRFKKLSSLPRAATAASGDSKEDAS